MGRYSFKNTLIADECLKLNSSALNKHGFFQHSQSATWKWSRYVYGDEQVDTISIRSIITSGSMSGANSIKLSYKTTFESGKEEEISYEVKLTSTPCVYGGKRWWFICPLAKNNILCNRRVAKLYKGEKYFGCRHCLNLTYYSKKIDWRSKYFPLLKLQEKEELEEALTNELIRNKTKKTYKNKLTKKYQKLVKITSNREGILSKLELTYKNML